MVIPPQLSISENIVLSLPSGIKATLPLCHTVFKKWTGELPSFDFGKKPIVNYEGKAVFAELAILKLFTASGWDGVWVETYGGVHFLRDMPESWKLSQSHISIPSNKESLLRNIWKAGKTTACFDVFAWKNNDILFCESKHKDKDSLTTAQTKFIEGALSCGVPEKSLLIAEWEYDCSPKCKCRGKMSSQKRLRERFSVTADQLVLAQCIGCFHLRAGAICIAYPNGIPKRILVREILHDRVLSDQQGTITFTPIREESR